MSEPLRWPVRFWVLLGLVGLSGFFCTLGLVGSGEPLGLIASAHAADELGNAPQSRPVTPGVVLPGAVLPGLVVPGLAPGIVLAPGAVLPNAEPGMVVPQVKLPDGSVVPGMVGPEGTVVPAVVGPEGTAVPAVVGPEGKLVPAVVGPEGKLVPAVVGPEGKLVPATQPPAQSANPAQPTQPTQSAQPTQPIRPGQPQQNPSEAKVVPAVPMLPQQQPQTVQPPQAMQPVQPVQPARPFSPADFLVREKDLVPTPESKLQAKADPVPSVPRKEPAPKNEPEKKPEPPKKPEQPPKNEPMTPPEKPEKPEKPEDPKAKGQALNIPEEAKRTKDVAFLEGCWKGVRPEYQTKRMITERFCFDAKGVGRRTILDPGYAGTCTSATRAVINEGGVLKMKSEDGYCTSGDKWHQSEMTCTGEGQKTPCKWVFGPSDAQSYSINFVRD